MSGERNWRGQPYLDELRPPPDWDVDLALFASYSIDLSALGAALLAITGRSDESGSGSVVDFAEAIETLRGKVKFIIQRGRISRPTRLPTVAGILDQFVTEVPYDEERSSWHPKAAMVRYKRRGAHGWRLWLGSRNLTQSADLDVGLLVETGLSRKSGRRVPGIERLAKLLIDTSGLAGINGASLIDELVGARWQAPNGIDLNGLHISIPGEPMTAKPADGTIDSMTIVSPFLCPRLIARAAHWGQEETVRTIVSTRHALAAIAALPTKPLDRFDRILALEAPEVLLEVTAPTEEITRTTTVEEATDDANPLPPSLHAKIFSFERQGRATMLVGSANATSRAWDGRNAEFMATIKGGSELIAGLASVIGAATSVSLDELKSTPPPPRTERDELETLRRQIVSGWVPRLVRDDLLFRLEVDKGLPALREGVTFLVGLARSELVTWEIGATATVLGEVPLSHQTDLLRCELRGEGTALAWMQRAPVTPPLEDGRDAAALSLLMGVGAFHSWMRQLLDGGTTTGAAPPWDVTDRSSSVIGHEMPDLLTLEDIVGSWGADRRRFRRADIHFDRYLDALLREDQDLTTTERETLMELRTIWNLARERLPA